MFTVPSYQRSGIVFTINARQSGNQISTTYTTSCARGATRLATVEPTTEKLLAYPNPTDDILTVQLPQLLPAMPTFTLSDVTGRTYEIGSYLSILDQQRVQITVRHLSTGRYILRIGGDGMEPQTVQFMKQ